MAVYLTTKKIIKDWTDYNGHMNVAYYVLIFDQYGSEVLLTRFEMGEHSAKTTKKSTMVVESHITYNQEVEVYCTHFDHDKKRLHLKCEMYEKETKTLAATMESLSLYIDLGKRKVTEFDEDKLKIMGEFINENKPSFKSENLELSGRLKK